MFPPQATDETTAVNGLLESLMRAGLEATGLVQHNGEWVVRLYSMPPEKGMTPLRAYARSYLSACGYRASVHASNCRMYIKVQKKEEGGHKNSARK